MKKTSSQDKRKQPIQSRKGGNAGHSESNAEDHENDRMHVKQDFDTVKAKPSDSPSPAVLQENGASISGGGSGTGEENCQDDGQNAARADTPPPAVEAKHTIRVVSLTKLLRPSLVQAATEEKGNEADVKPRTASRKAKKSVSIIAISDDSDEDILERFVIKKESPVRDESKSVGNPNATSVSQKKSKSSLLDLVSDGCTESDAAARIKELRIVVARLPSDLGKIKSNFRLSEIRDHRNVEIVNFESDSNRFGSNCHPRTKDQVKTSKGATNAARKAKIMGAKERQQSKAQNDSDDPDSREQSQSESENASSGGSKRQTDVKAGSSRANDSDSDEPVVRTRNKTRRNIPKEKKTTRATRKRRAVSDSDEELADTTGKQAAANGDSDESNDSVSDYEFVGSNTASSRNQRAAERSKRGNAGKSADSTAAKAAAEATPGEGSENEAKEEKEEFQPRKKRTRIRRNSTSSSDDDGKPNAKKRKRKQKKKNQSDSEGDSPNKGRKNIRKLLKKSDLDETTKNAEQEERERKQRIAERQKLYNQVAFDEKPEVATTLDQLVLDFDEDTKEPLLEVDRKLVKLLKPHQANGIKFMFDACCESLEQLRDSKGSGCILAHCMGLGKTLQVVTLAHTLLASADLTGIERILIVCPLSTVLNWVNEFHMWMKHVKKGTEVEVYEISKYKDNVARANKLMEWHNEGGVMIMGYDMFRNLANPTAARIRKKVRESLQTSLINPGPELIVCDEGHLLKNEKTTLSQAINRISTMRRIVLTGTPIQNNMKEYYCMVQFVKPMLLGTYSEYMNRFVNPITNGQYTDSTPYDIQLMRKRAHVLHKLLDGCVQRRDYAVLAPFLPPKLEFVVSIKLTPMQSALYKYFMETFAGKRQTDDPTQKRSSMLFNDFQNLQRIWTHPRVLRYNSDRYEIRQQQKRDLESERESDDIIDDDSSEEESAASTPATSDSDSDVKSVHDDDDDEDDNENSNGANGSGGSSGSRRRAGIGTRHTRNNRNNVIVNVEEEAMEKPENPTEWWMQMCPETELDNLEHSGKLIVLMEILKECEAIGDKLLVFSQSLYSLDVIEHFLSLLDDNMQKDEEERDEQLSKYPASWSLGLDYFRLDGSTSIDNRNDACKVFNDESNTRARLFLISTRAGGLGINLVAANRVVIFDVSWNPSHDIQSIFRVYRFGQNKPCYIYRFIAMGTMEEKIYERQVTKQAISKRVIDEQQIDRHYKENDLQELYRYDVEPAEPRPVPNVPKDRLFAELLKRFDPLIYKYHEHDSLLENKEEETLNEEERKAAWEEFEQEKNKPPMPAYGTGLGYGVGGRVNGPLTSTTIFGFRNDVLLKLLNIMAREDNPTFNDATINALIPFLMQTLSQQMKDGELTMYKRLWELFYKLEVPPQSNQAYAMGYASTPMVQNPMVGQISQPNMIGQQQQQQQQAMIRPGMGGPVGTNTMLYNTNPNQVPVMRPLTAFPTNYSEPGISGMPRFAGSAATGPIVIDPEVVELD
uniref:Transcriptional regulator ATRX n=1 Tax=Anopheles farauti TaxID=69004 RepID=A0A182Q624_9DIPT